jgi:hypothetical protein
MIGSIGFYGGKTDMTALARSRSVWIAIIAAGAAAIGCGEGNPGGGLDGGGGTMLTAGQLLPLKVGNTWTYRVTDAQGIITEKHNTAMVEEPVGGVGPNKDVMAIRMVTTKGIGGADETISWQKDIGTAVVRYREQSFGAQTDLLELEEHWHPYKVRVDMSMGSTWLEDYQEFKTPAGAATTEANERDRWTVLDYSQSVTVPKGTFTAVVLQKAGGSATKVYWFVAGVGKVKETGGQTEELIDYQVMP